MLIELFAGCYVWGATSEYSLKIGVFAPMGSAWPKISGRRGHPTNHSSCHKTRINGLSYGIRMWAQVSFVLSQITRLTDRRTDRRTAFSWLDGDRVACNVCSAVKTRQWEKTICHHHHRRRQLQQQVFSDTEGYVPVPSTVVCLHPLLTSRRNSPVLSNFLCHQYIFTRVLFVFAILHTSPKCICFSLIL